MGSGKGNVEEWAAVIKPGRIIFEMDGIPKTEAFEALRLANNKLPLHCKPISKESEKLTRCKVATQQLQGGQGREEGRAGRDDGREGVEEVMNVATKRFKELKNLSKDELGAKVRELEKQALRGEDEEAWPAARGYGYPLAPSQGHRPGEDAPDAGCQAAQAR